MGIRKVQQFVVKGKEIFIGLEDSKKTWKLAGTRPGMTLTKSWIQSPPVLPIRESGIYCDTAS